MWDVIELTHVILHLLNCLCVFIGISELKLEEARGVHAAGLLVSIIIFIYAHC